MFQKLFFVMLMLTAVALPSLVSATVQDQKPEKKEQPTKGIADHIKWETKEFENAIQTELGLNMRSVSVLAAETKGQSHEPDRVKFLLEFDKDANYHLEKLKTSLGGLRVAIDYGKEALGSVVLRQGRLELLYFDEENVCIGKASRASSFDGEITGKKGEAFRVYVRLENPKLLVNVKRIEVRLHPRLNVEHDQLSTEMSKAIKWETTELENSLERDYGLKLKSAALIRIEKDRHIMLDCERTKLEADLKGSHNFNLAGFFDRPFKDGSGGIESHLFGQGDTLLEVVKATPAARPCCIDDPGRLGVGGVGDRVTIFVRTPSDAVLAKATKAVLRIAAPEKQKEK